MATGKVEEDEQVILLTLPAEAGYEAPLWVPMGGYNECPLPEHQSVIFKHFQQTYQIKIVAVSEDTWILQAGKRPRTFDEALRLAKEHFIFCQYVMDGFPTLGHYADYLMKHDIWYFGGIKRQLPRENAAFCADNGQNIQRLGYFPLLS